MVEGKCPVCGAIIDLGEEPEVGEIVECPECGAALEVMKRGKRYYLEELEEEYEEEGY